MLSKIAFHIKAFLLFCRTLGVIRLPEESESLCVLLHWGTTDEILDSEPSRTQYMLQRGVLGLFFHFKIYLRKKKEDFFFSYFLFSFQHLGFEGMTLLETLSEFGSWVYNVYAQSCSIHIAQINESVCVLHYTRNGDLCILIHRTQKDVIKLSQNLVCLHIISVDYFQKKVFASLVTVSTLAYV